MPRVTNIGQEILVSAPGTMFQNGAHAASRPDGRYMVVWLDYSGYTPSGDVSVVRARMFDALGEPLGASFTVNPANVDYEYAPRTVALSDGRFLVTWFGWNTSLEGQVVNADGTLSGSPFLIGPARNGLGTVAALPDGGFVAVWKDGSDPGLRLQNFSATGTPVGTATVIAQAPGEEQFPEIVTLSGSLFAAVWTQPARLLKWAQQFDLNAAAVGSEFEVNADSDPRYNYAGDSIAYLDNGRYVIAWAEDNPTEFDTDGTSVRAQVFEADGSLAGEEFQVNTTTAGRQYNPSVAVAANGQFVIAWSDDAGIVNAQMFSAAIRPWNLTGTAGDDFLEGDRLVDTLSGAAGDDWLWGLGGNDTLDGGDGIDTIDYSEKTGSVRVTLRDTGDASVQVNNVAEDTVRNVENILGGSGQNLLTGNGSANIFGGGEINDVLVMLGGNDIAFGAGNNDYLYMGLGDDIAVGGDGVDVLLLEGGIDEGQGGDGQDYIFGGDGDDSLFGEAGVDVLQGEAGNDFFDGGIGSDYLYGGAGNDVAYGGTDVADDHVSPGNDIFVMEDGDDEAYGQRGQDYFYMGNGNDYANGGLGVDVFLGGAGNDQFEGGPGVDYAWGEAGNDGFIFSDDSGVMVIQDFTPGGTQDHLFLSDVPFDGFRGAMAAITYYAGMNTSILTIDADTAVWLVGVRPNQLTTADFLFFY
jgi:Ca2+-binding RTX toxin-like protein